ncbi:DUF6153 family protein [Nocardioides sp.]|uniref:DUF6153 family protein n=1 Tax=Nocardioides sp. TaxID=35761 RepID=UPI0035B49C7E
MIRTWWAAAAVLAIFAMHGLASHAGAHEPASTSMSRTHATQGHTPVDATAATTGSVGHGEPGHEQSVLGLCLVVLATSALLLLLRHGRPRSGLLGLVPHAATTSSYAVGVRSGPAPPDLHALSVLRC